MYKIEETTSLSVVAVAANNNNNNNSSKQFKLRSLIDYSKLAEADNEAQHCTENFAQIMIFYNAQGQIMIEENGKDNRQIFKCC